MRCDRCEAIRHAAMFSEFGRLDRSKCQMRSHPFDSLRSECGKKIDDSSSFSRTEHALNMQACQYMPSHPEDTAIY